MLTLLIQCVSISCSAIEQFARAKCNLNVKKDDGFAPIHLAALNDHLDVTTALADLVSLHVVRGDEKLFNLD